MRVRLVVSFLFLFSSLVQGAGFDCAKAATAIEKLVCKNPELLELDSQLAVSYKNALAAAKDVALLKDLQLTWLRNVRNMCLDTSCLEIEYRLRIIQLASASEWMTDEKEQSICKDVVDAINEGSIINRFEKFVPASKEDQNLFLEKKKSSSSFYYMSQTLNITSKLGGTRFSSWHRHLWR